MGPGDLIGAAALGGILVWAAGYWGRVEERIERDVEVDLDKTTAEWYALPDTQGHHALFRRVESKDGQTQGANQQSDEVGDLETRTAFWEGSE